MHSRATTLRGLGIGLAGLGVFLALLLLLVGMWQGSTPTAHESMESLAQHDIGHSWWSWNAHHPGYLQIVGIGMLVIAGGLMIGYCERNGYEPLARQYERLHVVFHRGERELEKCILREDWGGARRIIEKLGQEALVEHGHWLVLRRDRPFELLIGG